jgi:hypothetical protein
MLPAELLEAAQHGLIFGAKIRDANYLYFADRKEQYSICIVMNIILYL